MTALHFAANKNNVDVADVLVTTPNIDVNAKNNVSMTIYFYTNIFYEISNYDNFK